MGEKGGSVHGLNPVQVEKLILIRYEGRLKVVIKVSDGLFLWSNFHDLGIENSV